MVEKVRSAFCNKTELMIMLPEFYQNHLKSQLNRSQYLTLTILISLLQSLKTVNLESLANAFPLYITFEGRRRKIQRFLSLRILKIENIWFPILQAWLSTQINFNQVIYIAIDRTAWGRINLLMVSLIWERRAYPIYFELLPKLGASNLSEQKAVLTPVFSLLKDYKIVVLADREFCSVKLGKWLREQQVNFCLRLKKDEFVEVESEIWLELNQLGIIPGLSLFLQGVKVTKTHRIEGFNIAAKWKRKYRGLSPKEGWFILTSLVSLDAAIQAYQKRFDIEEMFRDFKSGGYNLEETKVTQERLLTLILLITLAYTSATMHGKTIKQIGVAKYVGRVKEKARSERRHSNFYIGLYGQTWVNYHSQCVESALELMRMNPHKRLYYQRGQRAMSLILSAL